MALIYLSCAWVAGIFLGSKVNLSPFLILTGFIPLPFLPRQHKRLIILSSLCLITLFGGASYYKASQSPNDESHVRFYNDHGEVEIKGVVVRDPEAGSQTTHLYLKAQEIKADTGQHQVSGNVLLFVPRYASYSNNSSANYSYGDVLLVKGKLETPPKIDGFDYKGYLAHQGIYSTMLYPGIEVLETGKGSKLLGGIYLLRARMSDVLVQVLPESQASLAQGIVLGIRSNIPESVKTDFINSGTAHLVAISGLNLAIVAGILIGFGIWLFGRRHYLYVWLALVTIWLYSLLTGMQPPVLRAAIMASLFLIADLLGRQRSAATALFLAAAVMVGVIPAVLWEASFQMSFMAMAGLIFIFPPIQSLGRKVVSATFGEDSKMAPTANFLVDSFGVSLGAVIAVWPLIAHYFGIVTWVGPLATFFAVPALAPAIIIVFLSGSFGVIFMPLAQIVAWFAWLFLSYILLIAKVFATVPPIHGVSLDTTFFLLYYSALALVIWLGSNRKKVLELMSKILDFISRTPKKWVFSPLLVIAILTWTVVATLPDDKFHISFLDVGQGDAILIQKGSQQILVDGGPSSQTINLALGREMSFWDRTIDLIVLTHPHADHLTGLIEVLKRYKIEQVLYSGSGNTSLYKEWLRLIEEESSNRTLAQAGQQIALGEVEIEVLNPPAPALSGTQSDADNNGIVLYLKVGEVSFVFTADIMREGELELINERLATQSTVLKVAHHGSRTSTTPEFLGVVAPQVAVISVGDNNSYGHPTNEVLTRLKEKVGDENIYRTDRNGTIEFTTDGERLWVRVEKPTKP